MINLRTIDPDVSLVSPLDRAVACSGFSPFEGIVVRLVCEVCEATLRDWNEGAEVRSLDWLGWAFYLSRYARATGINRRALEHARQDLVASKVIIADRNGKSRINDRIEDWIDPGSGRPRLTAKLLEFCRAIQPEGGELDGR